jgi:uncharacterized membrane protein (UPF0127 family)
MTTTSKKTRVMNTIAICVVGAVLLGFLLASNVGQPPAEPQFATGEMEITRGAQPVQKISVEIAKTTREMEYGLMFRHDMAADHGMIFIFPFPQRIRMWMKNTFLPLDMVFFDDQQKVIAIVNNTKPQDESIIDPGMDARYVLEINAGQAKKWNLRNGDSFTLSYNHL